MSAVVVRWDVLDTAGDKVDHIAVDSADPRYLMGLMIHRGYLNPLRAYTLEVYGNRISITHPQFGELYVLAKVG